MSRNQSIIRRVGLRAVVAWPLLLAGSALAQRGAVVADNPHANSDGPTIYKGQTYYPYGSNNDYGGFGEGLPIFRFGRSGTRFGAVASGAPSWVSAPAAAAPAVAAASYLTNQFHEPGDGWRYPLYYNPATTSYFYYPVPR